MIIGKQQQHLPEVKSKEEIIRSSRVLKISVKFLILQCVVKLARRKIFKANIAKLSEGKRYITEIHRKRSQNVFITQ